MKLKEQVVSLELAKKMKELGCKRESLFYWVKGYMDYGYEGEWQIKEDIGYFLFDHIVGYKWDKHEHTLCPEFRSCDVDCGHGDNFDEKKYIKAENKEKKERKKMFDAILPAYTVAELGEMLPFHVKGEELKTPVKTRKNIENLQEPVIWEWFWFLSGSLGCGYEDTEADARAKMWIYLKENGLIE